MSIGISCPLNQFNFFFAYVGDVNMRCADLSCMFLFFFQHYRGGRFYCGTVQDIHDRNGRGTCSGTVPFNPTA